MSLIDLKCQDSICCSKNYSCIYKDRKSLILGQDHCYDYIIYLYFNLPPYSGLKYLKQARLILFKLPLKDGEVQTCNENRNCEYYAYPLLDFFSIYSCMFSAPRLEENLKVGFENTCCCSYTEVDITTIVKAWTLEQTENKGLILMGNNEAGHISYASNSYGIIGMQPRLRLTYDENCICPPFVTTTCDVEVAD